MLSGFAAWPLHPELILEVFLFLYLRQLAPRLRKLRLLPTAFSRFSTPPLASHPPSSFFAWFTFQASILSLLWPHIAYYAKFLVY